MKENLVTSKSIEKTGALVNTQGPQTKNLIQNTAASMSEVGLKTMPIDLVKDEKINEDILNTFDFSAIDKLDPSLTDNFKKICDREMPMEIKLIEMDAKPEIFKEMIRFRLFCLGDESNPKNVKYELFSNDDLFFIYYNVLDPTNFKELQANQKVNVEYKGVNSLIKTLIDNSINKPDNFLCVLTIVKEGISNLSFKKKAEFKLIDILTLTLGCASEEYTKKQVIYRFNSAKSRLDIMQARLNDIYQIVGTKNPSLLTQIKKTPAKLGSSSNK